MAQALLFGIALSASIGGMATLIGSPPNAILAAFLRDQRQIDLNFAQWLGFGLPIALILLPIVWWLLCRVFFSLRAEEPGLKTALEEMKGRAKALGPMKREEWMVAGIFTLAAIGWIVGGFIEVPGLRWSDSMVALLAALLLFVVPVSLRAPRFLMDKTWTKKVNWEVLLLFGGGLCLATALSSSPYLHQLAELLLRFFGGRPELFLLASLFVVVVFSEIASNTATVAAFLPIVLALTSRMDLPVVPTCVALTLAGSLGFMLPVGTPPNAIVFSSGHLQMRTMIRVGLLVDVVGITVIFGAALSWFPWYW
jgi:sodium-dependent dicarboxylate transporter 2/3/5